MEAYNITKQVLNFKSSWELIFKLPVTYSLETKKKFILKQNSNEISPPIEVIFSPPDREEEHQETIHFVGRELQSALP